MRVSTSIEYKISIKYRCAACSMNTLCDILAQAKIKNKLVSGVAGGGEKSHPGGRVPVGCSFFLRIFVEK